MVKRRILCKTKFFANGRPVRTTTKYCITRPRLREKSLCDHHRRPVLGAFEIDFARASTPLPFVVSPVSCAVLRNNVCVYLPKIRPKNVTNFFVEQWEKSYTELASRKCGHNKSVHPCARAVAKVVRMPRSEVSERHRAGSWVWVLAIL